MAMGATALVERVRRVGNVESTQTRLGLIVVGFATAFELVVLAWSSSRRGIISAVVAGVVGSFTYNATMTLGAGALARPLRVENAAQLHAPWLMMVAALIVVVALAWYGQRLSRRAGALCLHVEVVDRLGPSTSPIAAVRWSRSTSFNVDSRSTSAAWRTTPLGARSASNRRIGRTPSSCGRVGCAVMSRPSCRAAGSLRVVRTTSVPGA